MGTRQYLMTYADLSTEVDGSSAPKFYLNPMLPNGVLPTALQRQATAFNLSGAFP